VESRPYILYHNFRSQLEEQLTTPGSFLRNFATLGSGTLLAQAIPVLVSPILTRLYSPGDFAMLAVFMAMLGTFTPLICGKYEVALVLPKDEVHAKHLFGIALYVALGLSIILLLVFLFFGNNVLVFIDAEKLGGWIFTVPVALFLTGIFTAANYLVNRQKNYRLLARARLTRAVLTAIVSIVAGIMGTGFGGLLAGLLCGFVVASMQLFYQNRSALKPHTFKWCKAKILLLSKYRHYPLYNATSGLLNGFTLSMPVFFISHYFPEAIVGYYAIVMQATQAPVAFISTSVSQINLKKVVDLINNGVSPIGYLIKLTGMLAGIITGPTLIIIFWGPELFSFVFGPKWIEAGRYARILMPSIAIRFIASILSSTLNATQDNRLLAAWQLLSFICTTLVLYVFTIKQAITPLLWAMTINTIFLYLLYLGAIFYAAHHAVAGKLKPDEQSLL